MPPWPFLRSPSGERRSCNPDQIEPGDVRTESSARALPRRAESLRPAPRLAAAVRSTPGTGDGGSGSVRAQGVHEIISPTARPGADRRRDRRCARGRDVAKAGIAGEIGRIPACRPKKPTASSNARSPRPRDRVPMGTSLWREGARAAPPGCLAATMNRLTPAAFARSNRRGAGSRRAGRPTAPPRNVGTGGRSWSNGSRSSAVRRQPASPNSNWRAPDLGIAPLAQHRPMPERVVGVLDGTFVERQCFAGAAARGRRSTGRAPARRWNRRRRAMWREQHERARGDRAPTGTTTRDRASLLRSIACDRFAHILAGNASRPCPLRQIAAARSTRQGPAERARRRQRETLCAGSRAAPRRSLNAAPSASASSLPSRRKAHGML